MQYMHMLLYASVLCRQNNKHLRKPHLDWSEKKKTEKECTLHKFIVLHAEQKRYMNEMVYFRTLFLFFFISSSIILAIELSQLSSWLTTAEFTFYHSIDIVIWEQMHTSMHNDDSLSFTNETICRQCTWYLCGCAKFNELSQFACKRFVTQMVYASTELN